MKRMKGRRILRKLKTISTPTWNFSEKHPIQPFQTSNFDKEPKHHTPPTNFSPSETTSYVKEQKPAPGPNADIDEQFLFPTTSSMVEKELNSNIDNQIISEFEEKCPPGGKDSVILYTTSLRGIRKTFEDCSTIKFLLESFRVKYSERDVSMHLEYREELWRVLGCKKVPPRLFIRGRYIGGADEVVGLHEKGCLKDLLQGITLTPSNYSCRECGGMRFLVCSKCNGSRKVMSEGRNDGLSIRCPDCNENGLVKCSICT